MKLRHQYNKLEDFLQDDSFVNWVLNTDSETNAFWNQWLADHPDQQQLAQIAIGVIKNLHTVEQQFTPNRTMEDTWEKIKLDTIGEQTQSIATKTYWLNWLKYAAVFLVLIAFSFLFYKTGNQQALIENNNSEWVLKENNDVLPTRIQLSDGSAITLDPFSSIKYPENFIGKERVVFLEGAAFFDIEKDTMHPFSIYTNEIITQVLGTSFTVKAFKNDDEFEVIVKTGKVAVFANTQMKNGHMEQKKIAIKADQILYVPKPNKRLDITRNQKVVFNKKKRELFRTIAKSSLQIEPIDQATHYQFENASLQEVFKAMETIYGIQINFDPKTLKGCTISTTLTDLPMLEKLELICQLHTWTFLERDGQIFITGEGCI